MIPLQALWPWWWTATDPVIGPARLADAEEMAAIHARSFHRGWESTDIAAMIADRAVVAHVIRRRQGADAAGFVLSRVAADEAEILTIAIAPALRGRGFAGRLLSAHIPDLVRASVKHLFLEVEAGNMPAVRLYERQDFQPVGRRKGYYRTESGAADAIIMRRDLPAI